MIDDAENHESPETLAAMIRTMRPGPDREAIEALLARVLRGWANGAPCDRVAGELEVPR